MDAHGHDVAAGEIGRILVRGVGTMLGDHRSPELTAEVLRPDGWLDTGDLGRLDARGDVHIVGRTRDLIKRAGFTVYPLEIESELGKHPAVKLAAAIGVPDGAGDEQIVCLRRAAARDDAGRPGPAATRARTARAQQTAVADRHARFNPTDSERQGTKTGTTGLAGSLKP